MTLCPKATALTRLSTIALAAAIFLSPPVWARSKYKVLHNFGTGKDGPGVPSGPLLLDGDGNLYGNTYDEAFELRPQATGKWKEVVLHAFASRDGSPWGPLILDQAGNLYGTTVGGPSSDNEVFRLSPGSASWDYNVLYNDGLGEGGAGPGLLMDDAGNLYGAIGRGQYKYGAIGELSPSSGDWTYTPLYSFCVFQCGYAPPAPPIWDGNGNLFGATRDGGISQPKCVTASGCGVIFEMTPNEDGTWAYHILHRFASFPDDGQSPSGGLVMDASGNLYGVTGGLGGAHKNGTVFKFAPSTGGRWKQTVLYDFPNCANGCYPFGTLAFDKAGNLYGAGDGGVADCQGYTCGVIFKLTPQAGGKWSYSVLHKFNGADGAFPWGVILDDKGNIFGTTENGGKYNLGVAFEITP